MAINKNNEAKDMGKIEQCEGYQKEFTKKLMKNQLINCSQPRMMIIM